MSIKDDPPLNASYIVYVWIAIALGLLVFWCFAIESFWALINLF